MGKVLAEGEAWVWDIEQSGAARVHCGAWELVGGGQLPSEESGLHSKGTQRKLRCLKNTLIEV